MYSIGICDDGEQMCSLLESMLMQYASAKAIPIEINIWYTGEGLCQYLKKGNYLDILFLDIELFQMTGIEVGDFIRNHLDNRIMQIIYISGNPLHAQKLFKTQPMDFLIKPITQQQLQDTMDLAIKLIGRGSERFEFHNAKEYFYVPYNEIVYFASEGRKVKVVMKQKEQTFYGKLKDIAKRLPSFFVQIHQSYIINMDQVTRYTYETVEMGNGSILTISKVNRKYVRETL